MLKYLYHLSILFLVGISIENSFSQSMQGFGMIAHVGNSQSSPSSQNNIFTETAMIATSAGFYKIFNLRTDTLNRMVNYLKVSLTPFAVRKGFFEVNSNVAKITSRFIDLELLIPIRFRLSSTMDIYIGGGPAVNFLIDQKIKWSGLDEQISKQNVHFGIVGEMGLLTTGSTSIGIRTYNGYSDYSFNEFTAFVGIGFRDIYNSRKRK